MNSETVSILAVRGRTAACLLATVLLSAGCQINRDPSLVAHYTFEEGPVDLVMDHSGQGNHGQNLGAKYVKLPNGRGYALRFDTPDAYVDCGNTPSLDLTGAITLELWFYPQAFPSKGEAGVIGKLMGSYCLAFSGNAWFYAPDGSSYSRSKPFSMDWHHLVATFDGEHVKMYCDGELQSVVKAKAAKLPHGENFYLRYPATYDAPVEPALNCMMDDVRVYSRALSDDQVASRYRTSAMSSGRHDTTWFYRPKLAAHLFPQSSTIYVEVDYSEMAMPAQTTQLQIELLKGGKAVLRHAQTLQEIQEDDVDRRFEFADVPMKGIVDWQFGAKDLPAGNYTLRATITDDDGQPIGQSTSADMRLPMQAPDWIKAYDDVNVLNNLVAELLHVPVAQKELRATHRFINPRDGWVFVSSTAAAQDQDAVSVGIDGAQVISHAHAKAPTLEAMRHLSAGEHTLDVTCTGDVRPTNLIVRAIPELQIAGLGYRDAPLMPAFGHYNAQFLKRCGLLDNLNVILERHAVAEDASYIADWLAQGKKRITRLSTSVFQKPVTTVDGAFNVWSEDRGLVSDGYHGLVIDEFSGTGIGGGLGAYLHYTEAIKRIAADPRFRGRTISPYCGPMHSSRQAMDLLKTTVDNGYKWYEEKYFTEQPTEQGAWDYIHLRFVRNTLRYEHTFPGAARHMVMVPGYMSAPPETLDINPAADFKVYMDMQMHVLANHPVLFGLYGVQWYHLAYADEEMLRFSAKLYRHYCIEGNTERLIDDPYMLPHITNPDFDNGDTGWTLAAAEPGAIITGHARGYGVLQTRAREHGNIHAGDNFLLTTRSAVAPNRFSQAIKCLMPGRTYSLKTFTGDYGDIQKGKSIKKTHPVNIKIDGVDMLDDKTFHQIFRSGRAGYAYPPFDRDNNLYITYHRLVFRARDTTAMLTICDWATDTDPGGPIGQELMHNFIEVQPYLDE